MGNEIGLLIRNYLDSGDEIYFKELTERFQPLIKRYARKLYYLEYEDSMQELTAALWETVLKMTNTEQEYACISYINKSIVHKFCKLYDESVKNQEKQKNSISFEYTDNWSGNGKDEMENCIFNVDLMNHLRKKTPVERNIIIMAMLGYGDEEIGNHLGCSRQYINRIKKKIIPDLKK